MPSVINVQGCLLHTFIGVSRFLEVWTRFQNVRECLDHFVHPDHTQCCTMSTGSQWSSITMSGYLRRSGAPWEPMFWFNAKSSWWILFGFVQYFTVNKDNLFGPLKILRPWVWLGIMSVPVAIFTIFNGQGQTISASKWWWGTSTTISLMACETS